MNAESERHLRRRRLAIVPPALDEGACDRPTGAAALPALVDLALTADYILDDCLFAMGQVVGTRRAIDPEAVAWLRDHFRPRFLRALRCFGDRWRQDRDNVTAVAFMLGERAVQYTGGASIGVEAVRRAAADVERYCQLHSRRQARARGIAVGDGDPPLMAGYWCRF